MIGIYREPPPPEQDVVKAFEIEAETVAGWDSIVQRGVMESFVYLTRAKDFLHSLGP